MFARFVASKRHTMEVDFEDYVLGPAPRAAARRAAGGARPGTGSRCRARGGEALAA